MKSVIVLEALDGVGKSTVAKLVAKKINAVVYRPSGRIKHATNEAIKLPYGSEERSGAIRNTLTMMSKEIKEVAQTYPVILDRFYASWASAEAGVEISESEIFQLIIGQETSSNQTSVCTFE